jgi:hypothetical protein
LFEKIRDGQAPDQLTQQLLKDWGFSSSNDRALIPLLKALNFLSPDGKPTSLYHEYRDHSRSRSVMATALREAYGDLFLIKAQPTESDRPSIVGKFKSYHNASDNVAKLMASTFFQLLKLADLSITKSSEKASEADKSKSEKADKSQANEGTRPSAHVPLSGLHYNIQIHLPATKDIEVYNAIFKALREHLFGE